VGNADDAQHGSPSLPHVQRPPLQVPPVVLEDELPQLEPSATQVPRPTLQHPLAQALPAQQGVPTVPHRAHRLDEVLHTEPAAQRSVPPAPEQQVWPGAPQAEHRPLLQTRPDWHVLEPQHGWPEAPQPLHLPPLQMPGLDPVLPPVPSAVVPQACASPTHISP